MTIERLQELVKARYMVDVMTCDHREAGFTHIWSIGASSNLYIMIHVREFAGETIVSGHSTYGLHSPHPSFNKTLDDLQDEDIDFLFGGPVHAESCFGP